MREVRHRREVRPASRGNAPASGGGGGLKLAPLLGLLALGALAVLGLIAWTRGAAGTPISLLVAADVSMSQSPAERRSYCNVLDAVVEEAMPPGSGLTLWSFDSRAGKLYTGHPRTPSELYQVQDAIMEYSSRNTGTSPASTLPEIILSAKRSASHGEPVAVLLLWDAEDERPMETIKLVKELADIDTLKAVWVVGVPTEDTTARSRVERQLSALGERLIVTNRFDTGEGLSQFRTRVRQQ